MFTLIKGKRQRTGIRQAQKNLSVYANVLMFPATSHFLTALLFCIPLFGHLTPWSSHLKQMITSSLFNFHLPLVEAGLSSPPIDTSPFCAKIFSDGSLVKTNC